MVLGHLGIKRQPAETWNLIAGTISLHLFIYLFIYWSKKDYQHIAMQLDLRPLFCGKIFLLLYPRGFITRSGCKNGVWHWRRIVPPLIVDHLLSCEHVVFLGHVMTSLICWRRQWDSDKKLWKKVCKWTLSLEHFTTDVCFQGQEWITRKFTYSFRLPLRLNLLTVIRSWMSDKCQMWEDH